MNHYTTLGNDLQRSLLRFSQKISKGLTKPKQNFVGQMLYGIIASESCKLTEIGRALKENIELKETEKRLGRNLSSFSDSELAAEQYLESVKPLFGKDTLLLIDPSDVTKPCSPKMEAIGSVYDASEGKYGDGYWTLGVAALTGNRQPIPIYERLYPNTKQGGEGANAEMDKAMRFIRENFDAETVRVLDRGFDSGRIMNEFCSHGERFILRANQNRVVCHHGVITKTDAVASRIDCSYTMRFSSKTGNKSICRIGITEVIFPRMKNLRLKLVVCRNFGDDPLVLYTNIDEPAEDIAERVVRAYLMRWRIEEMYAFKKQRLHFEDFRVRSLASIRALDLLVTAAIGYIGVMAAKVDESVRSARLIYISKRIQSYHKFIRNTKFYYYALLDGITSVFASLRHGIPRPRAPEPRGQLSFFPLLKMG